MFLKLLIEEEAEKLKPKKQINNEKVIDTGIVSYPDNIGTYDENTIISYQGKKYKCLSALELQLCNDKAYIPNGLHGYLAWKEVHDKKIKREYKKRIIMDGETPRYPDGISSYKAEQVVIAGDRKFECKVNKIDMCNNIKYDPSSFDGYKAWIDITDDVAHLVRNDNQAKPQGAEYIYPNGIEGYDGGTVVAMGQQLYRCKVGPESSLCSKEAYEPTGKYGSDAWAKIEK